MVRASKEVSQNSDDKREVGMESQFLNLNELRNRKPAELMRMARSLNIDEIPRMSKQDLIYAILRAESEKRVSSMQREFLKFSQKATAF